MIAIVGAGITGLTLAELLSRAGQDFVLFDAAARPGGKIRSELIDGTRIEYGPHSLRLNDALYAFLEAVGLDEEMVFAQGKKRYVLREGRYQSIPMGPVSLLLSGFLSWGEKRRLWRERKVSPAPKRQVEHESADSFFRRRFGDAVADYLAAPFISGIYAGDAHTLEMGRAFPQLVEWEQKFGSVIKGAIKGGQKQKHKGIISFREGMGALPSRLAERHKERLRLGHRLTAAHRHGSGWRLDFEGKAVEADQLVLTLPLGELPPIKGLEAPSPEKPSYPPLTVVHTLYERGEIPHRLDGFGALHNLKEESFALGVLFVSGAFPQRSPEGKTLLTSFVGGATQPDRARLSDAELLAGVHRDHQRFLGAKKASQWSKIIRWEEAIPQYGADLGRWQDALLPSESPLLGGNWTGGISVWNCMERARELAKALTGEDNWPEKGD